MTKQLQARRKDKLVKHLRASNAFTSLAALARAGEASRVCFLVFGLAITGSPSARAQSRPGDVPVASGLPDLRGLWEVHDPRTKGDIASTYDLTQSGKRLTLHILSPGKSAETAYEGTFVSPAVIEGQSIDGDSTPDSPKQVPLRLSVKDANRMELDNGLLLTRVTGRQAASFRQMWRLSLTALPARPFDLSGTWTAAGGYRISIRADNGGFVMSTTGAAPKPFFKGRYDRNPVIEGETWAPNTPADNPRWIAARLAVQGPDVIIDGGVSLYRASKPPSHDIPCDGKNSSHVIDYYAWVRGTTALAEKDYKTARCWLSIAADWEFPQGQSALAALILQGNDGAPPEYERAFELASKSAQQGDTAGQYQLAAMYRNGTGTPQDAEKAKVWLQAAQSSEARARMQAAMTPGNLANSLGIVMGMVGSMVDLNPGMTPTNSCYSQQVLGNRKTSACPF